MAKSKYKNNQEAFNKQVETGRSKGLNDKQIYQAMGISKDTFYKYLKKYPDFSDAHKKGTDQLIDSLENALTKRATGYDVEEYSEETKDSYKGLEVITKKITKHIPPSETALIFMLTNLKNDKWKRNPDLKSEGEEERGDVEIK